MQFNLNRYYEFARHLQIETKEKGRIRLGKHWYGSQTYLYEQIAIGLAQDIHHFVVLKGRQAMITTAMEALGLYWLSKYPGMQGVLVTDTDETKGKCRSELSLFRESLPDLWYVPEVAHNRMLLELENRSRLFYRTAGTRGNKFLGQGLGINYCHGTECGSWGSEEGVMSLMASFAASHPQRLFVFESTAHGFNYFHDMWEAAKAAKAQHAIFIGWWRNEMFQLAKDSPLYEAYWDGRVTGEEKEWIKDVKKLYNWDITSRQLAWWRQMAAEQFPDPDIQFQNYPPTEFHAFIKTGKLFFSNSSLTDAMKRAKRRVGEHFRFQFGATFGDTKVVQATERMKQLTIWERPDPAGVYAIGADPAYGSSVWADRFAIQVFRCYADGMDQVAEFATPNVESYQFAWVLAALCGMYKYARLNLEMNSCGGAVFNEMKNLKRQIIAMPHTDSARDAVYDVVTHMRFFMWQADDNISGPTNSIGWLTNERNKKSMLCSMRDMFELKRMNLCSEELLNEMTTIERVDGEIAADGRNKDDRVMAAGLAVACYVKKVMPMLIAQRLTREEARKRQEIGINAPAQALQVNVDRYLTRIGLDSITRARQ